ncbi:small serum protein 2-like [Sceloporus undulatus]|uniref:small serum protein 2-like n=1 Tax=Sceloporus undulatus TaxID=8520 RepID=UPI001C4D298B|nr:small serum protein 2-like [Sceloporus undulatus]
MKVLLVLSILSFSLALCHAACFFNPLEKEANGVCTDLYDGTKHPIGSEWNTADCLQCWCRDNGMECCHRYGGVVSVEGCTAVVDPETCKYKFYKNDDPSKPCYD